ncbi:hypothetical protein [Bacillus halotolerans]|uniref:hypothetical protein n=1 Tax=Bacillus halotolerans TaxID=260554 RepID=UPI003D1F6CD0
MVRKLKLFFKANNFPLETIINYLRYSTKSEKIFDFLLPFLLATAITFFILKMQPQSTIVVEGIKNINSQSLTFIAILAGFNVASISVLATAGSTLLERLRVTKSKKYENVTLFEIMMTFFSASIVSQFLIILFGLIILILTSVIKINNTLNLDWYFWISLTIWFYALITTLFVSIRNLKLLFNILVNEKHE